MQALDLNQSKKNFSFQTSSGDKININLYKAKKRELKTSDDGKAFSYSFASLERFQFKIEHNGLSEQDKKEINDMMKLIRPMIEEFYKEEASKTQEDTTNFIADKLKQNDENKQNYAKKLLVDTFDDVMKNNKRLLNPKKQNSFMEFLEDILYKMDMKDAKIYG